MPTLLAPLALLALASLPALAAIYWLRNRYRRQTVSSLMLWADVSQAREGGTRINRLQTPLLFLLELLALGMLAFAAAGPHAPSADARLPLVVVLDDSFSMLGAAGAGGRSARREAVEAIREELGRRHYSTRFILAGSDPRVLGEPAETTAGAMAVLEGWRCESPAADLDGARALASEIGGESARILVVTDRPPDEPPSSGRVEWRAFGRPAGNVAIVGAARSAGPEEQRCLVEVVNLSDQPAARVLKVETERGDGTARLVKGWTLEMSPNETRRLFFNVRPGTPALHVRLDEGERDAGQPDLAADNHAVLLPPVSRRVRVRVNITDDPLGEHVSRAVEAIPAASIVTGGAELIVTDRSGRPEDPRTWIARFLRDEDARPYTGPFVMDRSHPLTEGLSLGGVIWSAGEEEGLPGRPIIAAGNIVLLADADHPAGRHEVRLRYHPDLSTLHTSPNWPILMWNLIRWRGDHLPGLDRHNVRLGGEATLAVRPEVESVRVTEPGGETRRLPVGDGRVTIPADRPGVFTVEVGEETHRFAVNALHREESDLRRRASGRWGDWTDSPAFQWEYRSIAWLFGLLAAAALTAHLALVSRGAGKGAQRL